MTAAGFPDFTSKATGPVDFLTSIAVNVLSSTQSVDITALLTPAHEGLMFVWVADLASGGYALQVQVAVNAFSAFPVPESALPDGSTSTFPFPAPLVFGIPGNTCQVLIQPPPALHAAVTGTLLVLATTVPPVVIPATRRGLIGSGFGTGLIVCPAASTTTVLKPPLFGTYYVVKTASFLMTGTPASALAVEWQIAGTHEALDVDVAIVAAAQKGRWSPNMQLDFGVEFHNATTASAVCAIAYELWQV